MSFGEIEHDVKHIQDNLGRCHNVLGGTVFDTEHRHFEECATSGSSRPIVMVCCVSR